MWQYLENYHTFFAAIRERYPKIQLIADCDLTGQAPQDLWDWHIYTSAQDLFNRWALPWQRQQAHWQAAMGLCCNAHLVAANSVHESVCCCRL